MKVVTVTKRYPSAGVDGNWFVTVTAFVTACNQDVLIQVNSWLIQNSTQILCWKNL
jgi:hypothetical protein